MNENETRMSIEEINMADENIVEIEISEAFPFTTDGILDEAFEDKYVLLDGGTLDDIHFSTVVLDDVLETCATLGGQDGSHHGALDGRDQPNQHPIEAIEGLREELDEIEALQTVYSDENGIANYYLWEDGNEEKEDRIGYFVSKCSNNKIKKIESKDEDVFGVVTDTSAFVGGQADTPRNYQYGLIVCTGEAVVRCESDVKIGDCVTTNDVGIAQKATSGHGYRVSAIKNTDDFHYYATISLDVSANQLDTLGADIDSLEDRMDDAEVNITTANTLASTAYQLAKAANTGDIGALNASTVAKAEEALDKADSALANTEYLNAQIQTAVQSATQAKTIAANAVASATSMKNEAVTKSNQALSAVVSVRDELEANVANINKELDESAEELKQTQENLVSTRDELQGNIDKSKESFEALEGELIPLAEHPNGGVAGFVARADKDSVTLGAMVKKQDETSKELAGFKVTVEKTYATTEQLSSVDTKNTNATAAVKTTADANKATLDAVSSFEYKDDDGKVVSTGLAGLCSQVTADAAELDLVASYEKDGAKGLAGLRAQVDANKSELSTVASYEKGNAKGLAGLKAQVDENKSNLDAIVEYEHKDEDGKVVSSGIAGLKAQVNKNSSELETLAKFEQGDNKGLAGLKAQVNKDASELLNIAQHTYTDADGKTSSGLAAINQQVTDQGATIKGLTDWQDETGNKLTSLEQKSDANGAYIEGFVANIDKYSYGKYSQANRFTYEEALNILEAGMVFVPKETRDEIYEATEGYPKMTCSFTRGFSYTWGTVTDKDNNDVTTWIGSAVQDVTFSVAYQVGGAFTYWVATDDCEHEGTSYEKDCLYKWEQVKDTDQYIWIKVATLKGNLGAVTTSLLKQTSNSIEMAITDVNNNYAGTKTWVDDVQAAIETTAEWTSDQTAAKMLATTITRASETEAYVGQIASVKNSDGTINAIASIVAEVNKDGSSVSIDADKINFTGFTTFVRPGELATDGATTINGNNITTGTISSVGYVDDENTEYSATGTCFNLDDGSITAKNFAVDSGGYLYAKNADIEGTINATDGSFNGTVIAKEGEIGGWVINGEWLKSDGSETGVYCGLWSGNYSTDQFYSCNKPSLVTPGTYSNGRFYAGASAGSEAIYDSKFTVLDDGSLYASAAKIEGDITATSGQISNLKIDNGIKGYVDNTESFSLTSSGLIINQSSAKIQVGNFQTFYDPSNNSTYWQTNGPLYIQGTESGAPITAIELMTDKGEDSIDSTIRLNVKGLGYMSGGDSASSVEIYLSSSARLYYPINLTIYYLSANDGGIFSPGPQWKPENTKSITLHLDANALRGTSEILKFSNTGCLYVRFGLSFDTSSETTINIKESYEKDTLTTTTLEAVTQIKSKNNIVITGNLTPSVSLGSVDSSYNLGDGSRYWNTIYTRNSAIDLSDGKRKNSIQPLSDLHSQIFDSLKPISYKFNISNNNRTHTGFRAQDVKKAVEDAGITTQDFAAYCEWTDENGEISCGLRYSEFIALCVNEIQKLKKRVAELENK